MLTVTENNLRTKLHDSWAKVQKVGFWWLIIFIFGAIMGLKAAEYKYTSQFDDAIKLGGVIHKTVVYDVRLRP